MDHSKDTYMYTGQEKNKIKVLNSVMQFETKFLLFDFYLSKYDDIKTVFFFGKNKQVYTGPSRRRHGKKGGHNFQNKVDSLDEEEREFCYSMGVTFPMDSHHPSLDRGLDYRSS